jgi:hypothetical protein
MSEIFKKWIVIGLTNILLKLLKNIPVINSSMATSYRFTFTIFR